MDEEAGVEEGGCAFDAAPDIALLNKDGSRNTAAYCAWPRSHVTWAIENLPEDLNRIECASVLRDAFAVWTEQCELTVEEVDTAAGPHILIGFYSDKDYRDLNDDTGVKRSAVAYAPCDRPRKRGRIVFNTRYDWRLTSLSRSELHSRFFCFAVHEIGHALGIKVHGEQTDDVMHADPSHWRGTLSAVDIDHITTLYPLGGNEHDLYV